MPSETDMIRCDDALPLVPAYVDGELSEAQAGPLRKHLLDCVDCRGAAQDLKGLKRWFGEPRRGSGRDGGVPCGFAARVARRAFAGDLGVESPPAPRAPTATPSPREAMPFVRELVALAAAVLVMLAIGLGLDRRPAGQTMRADDAQPLNEIQEELERLNAQAAERASPAREAEQRGGPRAD